MAHSHKRNSHRLTCTVNSCDIKTDAKHLMLSITGNSYSDRVYVEHFGQTEAFLLCSLYIDCGMERKEYHVASAWLRTRCYKCDQKNRGSNPEWLNRPPCTICGATRHQAVGDESWDEICRACRQYTRKFGVARNNTMEATRQAVTAARELEAVGDFADCHNCGRVPDGKGGTWALHLLAKSPQLTARRDAETVAFISTPRKRSDHGTPGTGKRHLPSTIQPCFDNGETLNHSVNTSVYAANKKNLLAKITAMLAACRARPGLVYKWPIFQTWVTDKLVVGTGQSIKELFVAVQQDPAYTSTAQRPKGGRPKGIKSAAGST